MRTIVTYTTINNETKTLDLEQSTAWVFIDRLRQTNNNIISIKTTRS